ncbi:MAG: sodium-dependent transporter [Gemmatimonadales bacterium]|nr:sodium-dependent transporter [Gemmatimonadales bacterium]NIN13481.1 sodium-dependent transporter [Gemmatimonadales bacterium]NIQ99633.1 sodium-dependent transporter [Gemmatimonadales bacterium]NIS64190.1 sodium-dependent transporter [Gemmatimonadales bacterium]
MAGRNDQFSSRWGILLAAIGMAVGTGNIWRFPRVAAENGGGAFLIAWLVFMFAWSIPLVLSEFALGKHTRRGPAGAIGRLIGGKYNWMGVFVGLCTCFIMFYYSVVTGWCIKYFFATLGSGVVGGDPEAYWQNLTTTNVQPVLFHLLALVIGCFIISRGVVKGIERTNRILIPILFLLLIVAALRAVTLPDAVKGLGFLFTPVWGDLLSHQVWLEALSQSAWSVGAAWGLVMTYGVYLRKRDDFALTSYTTAFGDYSASLLAGIAVMCTVFAVLPEADALAALGAGNEGLTFIWLPQLFEQIPAGRFFLALFFLALSFAAMSSLIAMLEMATRIAVDLGMTRQKAVPLVGAVGFLLGLPSAWKLGFFQNQDWVWALGLMVSGLFISLAVIKFGVGRFREQLINTPEERRPVGRWFIFVIKYVIPLEFLALMIWWFYQAVAVYDPEGWWHPFHTFSVGTTVLQWGLLIAALILVNRWWAARVGARGGE